MKQTDEHIRAVLRKHGYFIHTEDTDHGNNVFRRNRSECIIRGEGIDALVLGVHHRHGVVWFYNEGTVSWDEVVPIEEPIEAILVTQALIGEN